MSQNQDGASQQAAADGEIKIELVYNPKTNQVRVVGPIRNDVLCYGILEKAKDNISAYNRERLIAELAAAQQGAPEQRASGLLLARSPIA